MNRNALYEIMLPKKKVAKQLELLLFINVITKE